MKKYLLTVASLLIALTILATTLSGCTSNSTLTTTTSTTTTTTRTITDLSGRIVVIPSIINRVAINFPALNEMIYMLGDGDKIVATVPSIVNNPIFVKMYPRLKDIPAPFGTTVNLESLIASKPDVCFLLPTTDDVIKSIQDTGIPVIITPGFTDAQGLKDGIRFVAKVLGVKEQQIADNFCTYYDTNVTKITSVTSSIPKEQRLKLYYAANNPLNTEGQGTLPQAWAEMGGAVNVAAEAGVQGSFKDVHLEDIIKWNPDVIVCRDFVEKGQIMNNAQWSNINAVKNNRVYVNPKGIFVWCARSADEALQTLWIAKTLYPDKFSSLDIRQETKNFYKQFYFYNLSEDDLNETLQPTS
jgi:iron complex transport system substrate-binding protein